MICRSCLRNTSRRPCCSRSGAGASTELQRSSRQCTRGRQARRAAERVCAFVEKRMTPAQETSNAVSMLLPTAVLNVWAAPDKLVTIGSAMHLPVSFTYHLSCACSRYSDRIPCCDWTRACSMCLARSAPSRCLAAPRPTRSATLRRTCTAFASCGVRKRPTTAGGGATSSHRSCSTQPLCSGAAIGAITFWRQPAWASARSRLFPAARAAFSSLILFSDRKSVHKVVPRPGADAAAQTQLEHCQAASALPGQLEHCQAASYPI